MSELISAGDAPRAEETVHVARYSRGGTSARRSGSRSPPFFPACISRACSSASRFVVKICPQLGHFSSAMAHTSGSISSRNTAEGVPARPVRRRTPTGMEHEMQTLERVGNSARLLAASGG